jgi:GNAT superfamily N-acetyltransferase
MPNVKASVRVRRAVIDERRSLEELQRRASIANPGDAPHLLEHPDVIELPEWQLCSRRVLVAESATGTLGFAVLFAPNEGNAELDGLFVEPTGWRQGVGRLLLSACMALARSEAARRITVVANPHAADFYRACGFCLDGTAETRFGPGLRMSLEV